MTHPQEDFALLHRLARSLHRTRSLNALSHLTLSLLVAPNGGGMTHALLLMVNRRAGSLQGMLGLAQEEIAWQLPAGDAPISLDPAEEHLQHGTAFCRAAQGLRLSLDATDSCAARVAASLQGEGMPATAAHGPLAELFPGRDLLALPLSDHQGAIAILVLAGSRPSPLEPRQRTFLELFASQAEIAMENCQLLNAIHSSRRDLSAAHERLIQHEKLAAIGEVTASLAHELRNPLMAVGGLARVLTHDLVEQPASLELAETIYRESLRLEQLLDNILAFSKKQVLCFDTFHLGQVLADIITLERTQLAEADIQLETHFDQQLPLLQGDAGQVRQVLINLVQNAIQSMPLGGTLTLRAAPGWLRGDPAVTVEVEDTGGGIPAETLRNIFNPFFTTKASGTGLGLSVCNRIVELHRGQLEVVNTARGACFRLHLPVGQTHAGDH